MWFNSIHMPHIRLLKDAPKSRQHTNRKYISSNKWRKYYGTKVWRDLREQKLQEQPLCEICLRNDKITPATQVHHIVPFGQGEDEQERWELFLNYDNLMSICKHCHAIIHGMHE